MHVIKAKLLIFVFSFFDPDWFSSPRTSPSALLVNKCSDFRILHILWIQIMYTVDMATEIAWISSNEFGPAMLIFWSIMPPDILTDFYHNDLGLQRYLKICERLCCWFECSTRNIVRSLLEYCRGILTRMELRMMEGPALVQSMTPHARRFLVLVQITLERESFSTSSAHVRLLTRVRLYVRAQVRLIRERLSTLRAFERLFSGVRSNVPLQQPRPAEALAAVRARTALVVRAHVHAVGRRWDVEFVAVRALAGLLVVDAAVDLAVTGQVAGRAVGLAAVGAGVDRVPAQPAAAPSVAVTVRPRLVVRHFVSVVDDVVRKFHGFFHRAIVSFQLVWRHDRWRHDRWRHNRWHHFRTQRELDLAVRDPVVQMSERIVLALDHPGHRRQPVASGWSIVQSGSSTAVDRRSLPSWSGTPGDHEIGRRRRRSC